MLGVLKAVVELIVAVDGKDVKLGVDGVALLIAVPTDSLYNIEGVVVEVTIVD